MNSEVSPPTIPEFKRLFKEAIDLKNEGRWAEAEQIFRALLVMNPASASAHAFLGDTLWDQGKLTLAVPSFQRAVELAPQSEMASLGLFHTLLESGDKSRALAEMDRFLNVCDSEEYQELARRFGHTPTQSNVAPAQGTRGEGLGMTSVNLSEQPDRRAELYAQAVQFFGKHLVSLTGTYILIDTTGRHVGEETLFSFSGFVMSFGEEWFFVTAGHVLDEKLDKPLKANKIKLLQCGLKDDFGPDAKTHYPTMIAYESTPRWYIDNRNLGLDVGVMYLRDFYRAGLQANGVFPISEENWVNQRGEWLDAYCLLGLPEELKTPAEVIQTGLGKTLVSNMHPVLLYVERTDQPHRELPPSEFPWFIGRVNTAPLGINSIVGMSGGPIFGFKKLADDSWRSWAVAVQSWWDPSSRTIYGCPIPIFARLLLGYWNDAEGED